MPAMASPGDDRYAPPAASVADVDPTAASAQLASRGQRFLGAMVDGLLAFVVSYAISKLLGWDMFRQARLGDHSSMVGNLLIGACSFLLLNGYLLVNRGQTVAKAILGMRIVRTDGGKVAPLRILALRYGPGYGAALIPLLGGLYGLVDSLLIFGAARRCLHDQIAGTIVVRT
jgi:uncharacterized RDD family membrane protein YckC